MQPLRKRIKEKMTAKEIRESFRQFFAGKGHLIVPSAPMVVKNDPTLMFTNAGMNQFKDIILGNKEPKCSRVVDAQKCLRVSGKHNDLEEVGHDTYHHTMFEMLGNWSFGDYFKSEAIGWAWEYLVDVLGIDKGRLYATVFEGSEADGLERDAAAASIWERYLPKERIINGSKHDNFWEMGDVGPCGPCSEIHIDLRPEEERKQMDGALLVNKGDKRVIEIWNLVFMEYNRRADMSLVPLPRKVIDTGMGFERLCAVMEGKTSNYDTDVFMPLLDAVGGMCGVKYGEKEETDVAMRVVSDHLRAIAFSIADGQLPGNAKAGYVIRRILRRAVRYGYTFLGRTDAFLYKLLPVLVDEMGDVYPELEREKVLISKVIKEEEEAFLRTLATGMGLLEGIIGKTKEQGRGEVDGREAFTLFDTYGFPLDLTQLICREQGLGVELGAFNESMAAQKERARGAARLTTGDWQVVREGETEFVGYDRLSVECRILRYREVNERKRHYFEVVLDKSPFYAEMGGQVGDVGVLVDGEEKIAVADTKNENKLPFVIVDRLPSKVDGELTARVDEERRRQCEANHTATHLLDQALRQVLGKHVEQRGSLVKADSLRFDFSHFEKPSAKQLREVERIVNANIRRNLRKEESRDVPIAEARAMGAIALFGEKYEDRVRVIKFGESVELCGGCHVGATGEIGLFHIMSESSVAAGVRRIEAVTGKRAEEHLYAMQDTLLMLKELMGGAKDLKAAIGRALEENKKLHVQVESYVKESMSRLKKQLWKEAPVVKGVKVVKGYNDLPAAVVKDLVFQIVGEATEPVVCAIGCINDGKPLLTVMVSKQLVTERGLNAGRIVKEAAKLINGGGGGAAHFATAGGRDVDGLNAAIDKAVELALGS